MKTKNRMLKTEKPKSLSTKTEKPTEKIAKTAKPKTPMSPSLFSIASYVHTLADYQYIVSQIVYRTGNPDQPVYQCNGLLHGTERIISGISGPSLLLCFKSRVSNCLVRGLLLVLRTDWLHLSIVWSRSHFYHHVFRKREALAQGCLPSYFNTQNLLWFSFPGHAQQSVSKLADKSEKEKTGSSQECTFWAILNFVKRSWHPTTGESTCKMEQV